MGKTNAARQSRQNVKARKAKARTQEEKQFGSYKVKRAQRLAQSSLGGRYPVTRFADPGPMVLSDEFLERMFGDKKQLRDIMTATTIGTNSTITVTADSAKYITETLPDPFKRK